VQLVAAERRARELRARRRSQAADEEVEVSPGQVVLQVGGHRTRQRPRDPDEHHADVEEGDVGGQVSALVGGVDQCGDRLHRSVTDLGDLGVVGVDQVEHLRHHCGNAQLEGEPQVRRQRLEGIVHLRGALGRVTRAGQCVDDHRAEQRLAVGEPPVERRDADAGPAGDVVERHVRPALGDQLARSREQLFQVAPGVGSHRHGHSLDLNWRKCLHFS